MCVCVCVCVQMANKPSRILNPELGVLQHAVEAKLFCGLNDMVQLKQIKQEETEFSIKAG